MGGADGGWQSSGRGRRDADGLNGAWGTEADSADGADKGWRSGGRVERSLAAAADWPSECGRADGLMSDGTTDGRFG